MGQYYKAVVSAGTGEWNPNGLWAANPDMAKLMEHGYVGNRLVTQVTSFLYNNPGRLVWAGDYADPEPGGKTLYASPAVHRIPDAVHYPVRYLVNVTKGEFVDNEATPPSWGGLRVSPLALLTAEGNGRGGGDYWGESEEAVGVWARDVVYTTNDRPDISVYTEIRPNFREFD